MVTSFPFPARRQKKKNVLWKRPDTGVVDVCQLTYEKAILSFVNYINFHSQLGGPTHRILLFHNEHWLYNNLDECHWICKTTGNIISVKFFSGSQNQDDTLKDIV